MPQHKKLWKHQLFGWWTCLSCSFSPPGQSFGGLMPSISEALSRFRCYADNYLEQHSVAEGVSTSRGVSELYSHWQVCPLSKSVLGSIPIPRGVSTSRGVSELYPHWQVCPLSKSVLGSIPIPRGVATSRGVSELYPHWEVRPLLKGVLGSIPIPRGGSTSRGVSELYPH